MEQPRLSAKALVAAARDLKCSDERITVLPADPLRPFRMQELLAVNFVVTSLKTLSSLSSLSDDEFKVLT